MFSPLEQFDMIYIISLMYLVSNPFEIVQFGAKYMYHISCGWYYDITIFLFFFIFLGILYCLRLFYNSGYSYYLIPKNFVQRFIEIQFEFMFNLIKQQLGNEYYIYFSLIFTIFYGILFFNLLSLLPFGFALTSHILLMLYISLSLGLGIFLIGINKHGLNFFWLFLPTCPTFLIPLLIIIEISSYIIRTFSLAIRLSANIMAGHTLMFVISSFLLKIMSFGIFFWFLSLILICLILMLELGVAILQAYVFTILILIYLNDSLKGPQH